MTAKEKTLPETAPLSPEEIIQLLHLTPLTEEGGIIEGQVSMKAPVKPKP